MKEGEIMADQTSWLKFYRDNHNDPFYENTYLFKNEQQRTTFWDDYYNKIWTTQQFRNQYTVNRMYFIRPDQNIVRVPLGYIGVYNCSYIRFKNPNYSSQEIFAFIREVHYVNDGMTEIVFDVDVMQTYIWGVHWHLRGTLIERMHTHDDTIGNNLVPENLELGEYTNHNTVRLIYDGQNNSGTSPVEVKCIVVAATFDTQLNPARGMQITGSYTGLHYNIFEYSTEGVHECNDFLERATSENKSEGIVSIFMANRYFMQEGDSINAYVVRCRKNTGDVSPSPNDTPSLDGYIPFNNKIWTYPYNFLYVTNGQGSSAVYQYEFFKSVDPEYRDYVSFQLFGDASCDPSMILVPRFYKNVGQNYNEKLTISGFPQVPYAIDSFRAWLAQSKGQIAVSALSAGINAVEGGFKGASAGLKQFGSTTGAVASGAWQAIKSGGLEAASLYANYAEKKTEPAQAHVASSPTLMYGIYEMQFRAYQRCITAEYAKRIDLYFQMFGYAQNRIIYNPYPNCRNRWDYIKTVSAAPIGIVPAEHLKLIGNILDSGCRFWHEDIFFGRYDIENPINPNGGETGV